MGFTTRRRVSIPPPLISQIASVFRNHEASPPNQEALIGATARLMRRKRHIKVSLVGHIHTSCIGKCCGGSYPLRHHAR